MHNAGIAEMTCKSNRGNIQLQGQLVVELLKQRHEMLKKTREVCVNGVFDGIRNLEVGGRRVRGDQDVAKTSSSPNRRARACQLSYEGCSQPLL
jgi:hypothetical protein